MLTTFLQAYSVVIVCLHFSIVYKNLWSRISDRCDDSLYFVFRGVVSLKQMGVQIGRGDLIRGLLKILILPVRLPGNSVKCL